MHESSSIMTTTYPPPPPVIGHNFHPSLLSKAQFNILQLFSLNSLQFSLPQPYSKLLPTPYVHWTVRLNWINYKQRKNSTNPLFQLVINDVVHSMLNNIRMTGMKKRGANDNIVLHSYFSTRRTKQCNTFYVGSRISNRVIKRGPQNTWKIGNIY